MAKQWNSPAELNTFTSEQGRKLKRTKLSAYQRNCFIRAYLLTHTHARETKLRATHPRIMELLLSGAARKLGLSLEYLQALPKELLPYVQRAQISSNLVHSDSLHKTISLYFSEKVRVPWVVYDVLRYQYDTPATFLKNTVFTPEERTELHTLLQQCAEYEIDYAELRDLVTKKVYGCNKAADLVTQFPTAECYMDSSFYQGEPEVPAEIVPVTQLQAVLSKFS